MLSKTLLCGKRAYRWKTVLTGRRFGGSRSTRRPWMVTLPASGRSKPPMMRSSVVLPQPLGPSRETKVPGSTRSETSSRAVVAPKRLVIPADDDGGVVGVGCGAA